VLHYVRGDGVVVVSTTAPTAKYRNLRREPWAALKVDGRNVWSYAVIEAEAELSAVAAAPDDAAVEELVEYFRQVSGEHSDWDEYRNAMVSERRVVVRLTPTRAYGLLR
jgi:PPOX class probable F420-dependent enzyme